MKKKVKASTIIITSIVCVSAISLGLALGIIFGKSYYSRGAVSYVDVEEAINYEDDTAALFAEYEEGNREFSSYKPYELVNIGIEKFAREEHTQTITHGLVKASVVKQNIFAEDVRDGDEWYTESLSYSSLVKCGVRFYQHGDQSIDEYRGKKITEKGTATWPEYLKKNVTLQEHETNWGKTLKRPVIYIISSKTVLESKLETTEDEYVVTMDLHTEYSVSRYVKQMKSISDLEDYPQFYKVSLKFTMDKELNLKELITNEEYDVYAVGMMNRSVGSLTEQFIHNYEGGIPDTETNFEY